MAHADWLREHPDSLADALPPLAVDRQRIVHSAAFRRLQHKTQVFVAPQSDHFRTRLTHTLEVAQQARVMAHALDLNVDLAETVALAHDLGHPPFGHAGERALDACLEHHGGFEHNRHTLRVVEHLEHPYAEFHGLNLTRVVRECLAKHSTRYDHPGAHPLRDGHPSPPEGQVVDLADRLAYTLHDLLDGLHAGLLGLDALQTVALWRSAYIGPTEADGAWRGHLRATVDRIQYRVLADLADTGRESAARSPALSPTLEAQLAELDRFLLAQLYHSAPLRRADEHAHHMLTDVFNALVGNPAALPPRFRRRLDEQGPHRVVTDYVAGMTDRFCLEQAARLADLRAT